MNLKPENGKLVPNLIVNKYPNMLSEELLQNTYVDTYRDVPLINIALGLQHDVTVPDDKNCVLYASNIVMSISRLITSNLYVSPTTSERY